PAGTWSGPFPLVCFHTTKEMLRVRLPRREKRSSVAHRRAAIHPDQERGSEAKHGCRSDEEGADLRAGIGVMFRFEKRGRGRAFRATNKKLVIAAARIC